MSVLINLTAGSQCQAHVDAITDAYAHIGVSYQNYMLRLKGASQEESVKPVLFLSATFLQRRGNICMILIMSLLEMKQIINVLLEPFQAKLLANLEI